MSRHHVNGIRGGGRGGAVGYPFPEYATNQQTSAVVMLPNQVECIQDYPTCRAMLQDASSAAIQRAHARNDPKYLQYAKWFSRFRDEDRATIRYTGGDETNHQSGQELEYWGGCKVLLMQNGTTSNRDRLWDAAKKKLQTQSLAYHTNQFPKD